MLWFFVVDPHGSAVAFRFDGSILNRAYQPLCLVCVQGDGPLLWLASTIVVAANCAVCVPKSVVVLPAIRMPSSTALSCCLPSQQLRLRMPCSMVYAPVRPECQILYLLD